MFVYHIRDSKTPDQWFPDITRYSETIGVFNLLRELPLKKKNPPQFSTNAIYYHNLDFSYLGFTKHLYFISPLLPSFTQL